MDMKNVFSVSKEGVTIKDGAALRTMMDGLIYDAVFSEGDKKNALLMLIKEIAKAAGAIPASDSVALRRNGQIVSGVYRTRYEHTRPYL